ncbi:MAG: extracellular solute-binding protein [Hyphomicrobiales bacterium]
MKMRTATGITRREGLFLAGGTLLSLASGPVLAQELGAQIEGFADQPARHGMSIFGDLKYPAEFSHFEYANASAPKGGRFVLSPGSWFHNQNPQTFNTLNGYVTKGDAPPRLELIFDSLMARAHDEPDAVYGLVADSITISEDGNSFLFSLRPQARFHDGTPLTAEDVAFSLTTLQKDGHPDFTQSFRKITSIEALDTAHLLVTLDGTQSRGLIFEIAGAPIFSKTYYADRDFTASTMDPPLASGPYRIGRFDAGAYLEYERIEDYWARDLPIMRGQANFDVVRVEFYRERQTAFEAFKKGNMTFREEFTSKTWETEYNFPAALDGRVKKELFPAELRPRFQGSFLNTRRQKFADPRTREALVLCFDYEWVNENLFFNAYSRVTSYVEGSIYKAEGAPSRAELALLEPFRHQLPETVFGDAYLPPVSDGSGRDRNLLRRATQLLSEAGWQRRDGGLYDANGQQLTMEIMVRSPVFERVYGKYVDSLRAVGVEATIRVVDAAQFQARSSVFDYDMVGTALSLGATPFTAADQLFSSHSADLEGSNNWAGIKNPVVDALTQMVEAANDRETHQAAWRALDRVVRAGHYWLPGWYSANHRIAVWDKYEWPDTKPDYYFPVETTWWSKTT